MLKSIATALAVVAQASTANGSNYSVSSQQGAYNQNPNRSNSNRNGGSHGPVRGGQPSW